MSSHKLALRGVPLAEVVSALSAEFSAYPSGTKLPSQQAAPGIFGCGSTQYMKALKQLCESGVVTKVGQGIGYVAGVPTKERVKELKEEQRARGRKLINNTRSKGCVVRSVNSRELRKQVRDQMLQAIVAEGLDRHVVQALRDHDLAHMQCVEKAMKLVGVDFDHSEEAAELLSKQTATAAAAIASVAIAFRPATGPNDQIRTELTEVEVEGA